METVFVVFYSDCGGQDHFVGVFATQEGAEEHIDKFDSFDRRTMRISEEPLGA